jgi:hypothetical protein
MNHKQRRLGILPRGDEAGIQPSDPLGEPPHSTASVESPTTADLLAELVKIRRALERPAAPPVPRLAYREREIPAALGISLRLWQRAIHLGEAPQADLRIGRVKLWSHERLAVWMAQRADGRGDRRP